MSNNTNAEWQWREYAIEAGIDGEEVREWSTDETREWAEQELAECAEAGAMDDITPEMQEWAKNEQEPTQPKRGDILRDADGGLVLVIGTSKRHGTILIARYETIGNQYQPDCDCPSLDIWNDDPRVVVDRDPKTAKKCRQNANW